MKTLKIEVPFAKGLVTLILEPYYPVNISYVAQTEEGHSSVTYTYVWYEEQDELLRKTERHSSDCDGPLEHTSRYTHKVSDITHNMPNKWVKLEERQRDYFAESMNY